MPECFAIIVGSGFDALAGDADGREMSTRYGEPSAPLREMTMQSQRVLVLPRHGDDHTLPPHAINYRANIAALAELGVTDIIALNTVGVISHVSRPGETAVPDQIMDYTWGRDHTFHEQGADFAHIDFTKPFCPGLRTRLLDAASGAGVDCFDGGVYAATQGPRLETAAEIDRLERDGADFVGMTAMPEAALARELDINYACLALIVNRAAGRGDMPIHEDVEASTRAARNQAMAMLRRFFQS